MNSALTTSAPGPATPAPQALIDYDFRSILAAPPRGRLVLWLMALLIASGVASLAIAQVDEIVTATGKMITSDSEVLVQPFETAVVRSIKVRVGDHVKAGEVLATLDPTFTEADEAELAAKLSNLRATFNRLTAELAGQAYNPANPNDDEVTQRDVFQKRHAEFTARVAASERKIDELKADLAAHRAEEKGLKEQIDLARDAEQIYQTLVSQNLASKLKLIETMQRRAESTSRLQLNLGEQQKLTQQIDQTLAEREAFASEWYRKTAEDLAQTRSERDGVAARLTKAKLRRQLDVLRAPRDAIVLEIMARPPGSILRDAEPLMRLVPEDAVLVAEVDVDTKDVARLRVGDEVTLKFEALPWQQYGLAYGKLLTLTADAVSDRNYQEAAESSSAAADLKPQARQSPVHYRARVEMSHAKFRNLPSQFALRPGMRVVGDIKVGRRSILSYVLNPLTRVIDESLREP